MKKIITALIFILAMTTSFADTIGLTSGSETGTYYKFAQEIANVCQANNIPVEAFPSKGSLENIERVLKEPKYQFGMVQSDALEYWKIKKDKDIGNKIKMIFPLYNEEIHILVGKNSGINKITDLNGKKVNIDIEGSGSWVTGNVIQKLTNTKFDVRTDGTDNAIISLVKGEIDAVLFVAGAPSGKLDKLNAKADVAKRVLKLLSFEDNSMNAVYDKANIPAGTYAFVDYPVKTFSTRAVLITYNYQNKGGRFTTYYNNIYKFIYVINSNMGNLRKNGHDKWKQVNPTDITKVKWGVHEQALKAIQGLDKNKKTDSDKDELLQGL